jgi:hypothetical protein
MMRSVLKYTLIGVFYIPLESYNIVEQDYDMIIRKIHALNGKKRVKHVKKRVRRVVLT